MITKIIIKTNPPLMSDIREVSHEEIILKEGYIKFSRKYELNCDDDLVNVEGYHSNYEWIYESTSSKSIKLFNNIVTSLTKEINNHQDVEHINDVGGFDIIMFNEDTKEIVESYDYNFRYNAFNESMKLLKKLFPSVEDLPRILRK